jgi:hypothetical protein
MQRKKLFYVGNGFLIMKRFEFFNFNKASSLIALKELCVIHTKHTYMSTNVKCIFI